MPPAFDRGAPIQGSVKGGFAEKLYNYTNVERLWGLSSDPSLMLRAHPGSDHKELLVGKQSPKVLFNLW